ncbi:CDP-alcohol phosphatidyltransferase family protein [Hyphococcus luteus]|uniref:CDP-alcohol phosphatidyltransferase n=1 Tax=Hyphococcus luteus TaxID=2058213 RepID=A0A2S7KAS3_9PROT|nr:CDP-alcohol phosphatidyltransferase family protein [Marinicaulis flavus]PQA89624.1 hypothetical protein CW354_01805 [Marinicaulis flavus]
MASIYDLKPKFQALLRPFCGRLAGAGVTANQVTLIACGLSLAHGAAHLMNPGAKWVLALLPLILFLRMALNAIDGMLAREFGQASKLGAILNELTDVISDAALYLPFVFIPGLPASLVVVAVTLGIIAEMTGVVAVQIGASRRYDGPFGKSDRAFFFGALALLLVFFEAGWWSTVLMAFACALGAATIVNRARSALKEVSHADT